MEVVRNRRRETARAILGALGPLPDRHLQAIAMSVSAVFLREPDHPLGLLLFEIWRETANRRTEGGTDSSFNRMDVYSKVIEAHGPYYLARSVTRWIRWWSREREYCRAALEARA